MAFRTRSRFAVYVQTNGATRVASVNHPARRARVLIPHRKDVESNPLWAEDRTHMLRRRGERDAERAKREAPSGSVSVESYLPDYVLVALAMQKRRAAGS